MATLLVSTAAAESDKKPGREQDGETQTDMADMAGRQLPGASGTSVGSVVRPSERHNSAKLPTSKVGEEHSLEL